MLAVISPICDLGGLENERGLLTKIEEIEWITSPSKFIQALVPGTIWSRDTHALSQGAQAPLHLSVETAVVSNTSTLSTSRNFLNDAIRLARQVNTKLDAAKSTEHFVAGAQSDDELLRRRLRNQSLVLFGVLAIGVVAALAWVMHQTEWGTVAESSIIVGGALAVAGLYALLVDRAHAVRALGFACAGAGAIAPVDQLLAHL